MLHRYSFSNFHSFRDRVEVDLVVNKKTALTDWMSETPTGERVSRLMGVIGANGSGKTSLLKALAFMDWFVASSFQATPDSPLPFYPHFATPDAPSEFSCVFNAHGKLWRYDLRCTPQRVLHEALYVKKERFTYVFVRDWDERNQSYRVKQQDFGMSPQEARKVRANASLIATAAQYGVPLAQQMLLLASGVLSNLNYMGRKTFDETALLVATRHFAANEAQRLQMSQLLSTWDLGLTEVELREIASATPEEPEKKIWYPFGKHRLRNTEATLPFAMESSGTRGAFTLLALLLPTLSTGGLAIIDEFENDLHPHMLEPILDLFGNPATNPHNAQLLFTCHAPEVLHLLHKSQVTLVEKDEFCESTAYRLDEVEGIRNDDNLYAKYMAGAYGAVPNL